MSILLIFINFYYQLFLLQIIYFSILHFCGLEFWEGYRREPQEIPNRKKAEYHFSIELNADRNSNVYVKFFFCRQYYFQIFIMDEFPKKVLFTSI